MIGSLHSRDVADYLLAYTDREAGETISNLKLLKLVYYAQGFCLAMRGRPLFPEVIEAWDKGPVVRAVYDAFKHRDYQSIPAPADFDPETYLPEDRELLDAILNTYGQLSARRLSDLTHEEPPWRDAYLTGNRNEPITIEAMAGFFDGLIKPECGLDRNRPEWPTRSFLHQKRRDSSDRLERHRDRLRMIASSKTGGNDPWGDGD